MAFSVQGRALRKSTTSWDGNAARVIGAVGSYESQWGGYENRNEVENRAEEFLGKIPERLKDLNEWRTKEWCPRHGKRRWAVGFGYFCDSCDGTRYGISRQTGHGGVRGWMRRFGQWWVRLCGPSFQFLNAYGVSTGLKYPADA